VRVLGHLDPDYARILRQDDGVEPELRFYTGREQGVEALIGVLAELRNEGYRGPDVAVLSPRASGSASEGVTEQPWRDRLRPLSAPGNGHVRYGTIHAFKGMEAPAIVVTDLEDVSGPGAEALFYIVVTRPTERLILLIREPARASIGRLLAGMPATEEPSHA
jgi:superfamily I DNA/RNA helicase